MRKADSGGTLGNLCVQGGAQRGEEAGVLGLQSDRHAQEVGHLVGRHRAHDHPLTQQALVDLAPLRPLTPGTITDRDRLLKALAETRARGWAIDEEETTPGVVCFAVPLLQGARPVAGISITVPRARMTEELQEQVIRALLQIQL